MTIFDLPHVADAARDRIAAAGLSDRCEVVGGDAFVAVPAGADAYVLKGVIHDWEDKEAVAILRTCRAAMSEGSKLLLIERILPEQIDPDDALTRAKFIHDINMMVNPGGRERTEAEFHNLACAGGPTSHSRHFHANSSGGDGDRSALALAWVTVTVF